MLWNSIFSDCRFLLNQVLLFNQNTVLKYKQKEWMHNIKKEKIKNIFLLHHSLYYKNTMGWTFLPGKLVTSRLSPVHKFLLQNPLLWFLPLFARRLFRGAENLTKVSTDKTVLERVKEKKKKRWWENDFYFFLLWSRNSFPFPRARRGKTFSATPLRHLNSFLESIIKMCRNHFRPFTKRWNWKSHKNQQIWW